MSNPSRSILEERPPIASVGGRIRTGIKVLKSAARANAEACRIYEAGVAAGRRYDDIERDIETRCKIARALVPRNTPYFRIARGDFRIPEYADRILDLYGEDRGEGRQLYRFPVILAFDEWLSNMPHGLAMHAASGRRYWSEYDAAGTRFCMEYAAAEIDPRNQRARRAWGGRKAVIRQDNNGLCEPEGCAQYQCGDCKLTGRLLFYVPGIPGSSLIEMSTSSVYSLQQMRGAMELAARIRHGRIGGTINGNAFFLLMKERSSISRIVDGKPTKTEQFLVRLESALDMGAVMAQIESREVRALAAPAPVDATVEPQPESPPEPQTEAAPQPPVGMSRAVRLLRAQVLSIVTARGETVEKCGSAYEPRLGADWTRNEESLRIAIRDMGETPCA